MIMPGVQKPHWRPCFSQNAAWSGWRASPSARPSIVRTLEPSAWTASIVQRLHGHAVDVDGAGAALARVAADVGAGQVQVLAQGLDEQPSGLDVQLAWRAVDHERDVFAHGREPPATHWWGRNLRALKSWRRWMVAPERARNQARPGRGSATGTAASRGWRPGRTGPMRGAPDVDGARVDRPAELVGRQVGQPSGLAEAAHLGDGHVPGQAGQRPAVARPTRAGPRPAGRRRVGRRPQEDLGRDRPSPPPARARRRRSPGRRASRPRAASCPGRRSGRPPGWRTVPTAGSRSRSRRRCRR